MKFLKTNTGIFILLFIISFSIKLLLLLIFNFDGYYGQDAYAYYDKSSIFIDSLYNFQIPPNLFWPIGFYSLTFLLNILTFGNTSLAAFLVSLTAGSLLPGATYLLSTELTKEYYEPAKAKRTGLYAGLIICLSGVIIKSGMVVMSDMPGLLFVILSVYYFSRYRAGNHIKHILLMGAFLSFSILIRYANILMVLLYVIIFVIDARSNKKPINVKHYALSLLIALVIFSPQLYYILKLGIPYFTTEKGPGLWFLNWNPLNFFKKDFFTNEGLMNYRFWNLFFYSSFVFHPLYLFVFGLGFISGVYYCFKNSFKTIILFLIPWILIHVIYLAGCPFQSGRYALSFFPPLAIMASIGIAEIKINVRYKKIFTVFAFSLLLIYGIIHINTFVSSKSEDLLTVNYLKNNIPANSLLLSFEITGAVNHYTNINHRDLYYYNPGTISQLIDSAKTDIYMIIPETKMQTQWKGLTLEKTYNYIKENYNLQKLYEISYYTIYRVNGK